MAITNQEAIDCVRRAIDQIELSITQFGNPDDGMGTEEEICEYAQSLFSDEDILQRFLSACRYVAARVGSVHLPALVSIEHPSTQDLWPPFIRVVEESTGIIVSGEWRQATRRSYRSHADLEKSGRCASDQYPVYTYEDYDLNVYGSTVNPVATTVEIVKTPTLIGEIESHLLDAVCARTVIYLVTSFPSAEETVIRFKLARAILDDSMSGIELATFAAIRQAQQEAQRQRDDR